MMNVFKIGSIRFTSNNVGILTISCRNFHVAAVLRDKSFYEILRIPPNATQSEIKDAYYKLSKVYHPDIKKDDQSLNMFRSITEAYDTLSNLKSRKLYDIGLGKHLPHETLNEPFYASMFAYKYTQGGIVAAEYDKILQKKTILNEYLDNEYHDRRAEYQTYQKGLHEHMLQPHGEFGYQRILFTIGVTFLIASWTFFEYIFSMRELNEATKQNATFKAVFNEFWQNRFKMF